MKFIEDIITEWAENVIEKIRKNLDDTNTTASGNSKRSLELVHTDTGFQIVGRPYFRSVEEGRPAGKVPYRFQDILYDWAEAKGILKNFGENESKQRSALYMVGQFIKTHGTKLWNDGPRTDIYSDVLETELPKLFNQIEGRILEDILREL